jgi:hypothetical protein
VHIYSPAAVSLNANSRVISIHAPLGVNDVITLKQKAAVLDLYTGKIVAHNQNRIPVKLAPGEATLWYIGNDTEIKQMQLLLQKGK